MISGNSLETDVVLRVLAVAGTFNVRAVARAALLSSEDERSE